MSKKSNTAKKSDRLRLRIEGMRKKLAEAKRDEKKSRAIVKNLDKAMSAQSKARAKVDEIESRLYELKQQLISARLPPPSPAASVVDRVEEVEDDAAEEE
jgi:hypothetical protein